MTAHPTQSNPTPPVIDRPGTASVSRSLDALILEVTHRLVQEFNPENIFLFGSHVWGTPHADSDLDLLVIVPTSQISSSKRSSIAYRCLRDILYPLDILVKTRQEVEKISQVPASLEHQILSKGKCLYEQ
jgi:uncharacterized protein